MTPPVSGGVPEQGLPIRILGDPILRRYAEPWAGDPGALTSRLERTMRAANGIGLAAPQIGESVRVAVIAVSDRFVMQMVNPLIVWRSDETATELEGCLSIPGYEVPVTRPVKITIDVGSNVVTLEGIQARAAQHEIDHLDGILILDRWLEQRAALERPRPALPAPEPPNTPTARELREYSNGLQDGRELGREEASVGIPRRIQMLKWCDAERMIQEAVDVVERMGADVRLTDAVCLLGAARDRVADFVDGIEGKRTMPRDISTMR